MLILSFLSCLAIIRSMVLPWLSHLQFGERNKREESHHFTKYYILIIFAMWNRVHNLGFMMVFCLFVYVIGRKLFSPLFSCCTCNVLAAERHQCFSNIKNTVERHCRTIWFFSSKGHDCNASLLVWYVSTYSLNRKLKVV